MTNPTTSAQSQVPTHRHGYVRPHLIEEHGYSPRYVETSTTTRLLDEHERLHADETAKNLGHSHEGNPNG